MIWVYIFACVIYIKILLKLSLTVSQVLLLYLSKLIVAFNIAGKVCFLSINFKVKKFLRNNL